MAQQFETISKTLSADVAQGGTFTMDYPAGKTADDYVGGTASWISSISRNPIYQANGEFTLSFGASNISVTLVRNVTFMKGETVYLNLAVGAAAPRMASGNMSGMTVIKINLGAPIASDPNGAVESQACTAANGLATGINGALAADGVATFDVPRNVVAAWTGTAVLTVTGTDEFGNVVVESSASETSMAGKKAFKTITGVAVSANVTGLTVGTGKVLGLPVFLGDKIDVLAEAEDGAAPSAGTVLDGVTTTATATTGDVRGTYAPNSDPNGSLAFELIVAARDPLSKGVAQFAG